MEPYLGEITIFTGDFAPQDWLFCHGQFLQIRDYQALFSIMGVTYGGDGRTQFALPDLRGRVPIGVNQHGTSDLPPYGPGQEGGVEKVYLNAYQIPAHNHTYSAQVTVETELAGGNANGTSQNPKLHYFGQSVRGDKLYTDTLSNPVEMHSNAGLLEIQMRGNTEVTGEGQGHNNMAPSLAINYIICINGRFPY